MRRFPIVILVLALVAPAVHAANDPWIGRSRDEVVVVLGEPDRAKVADEGSGRLVFKFHPLREGAVPGPRRMPVTVDGIGTLFRVLPLEPDDSAFEPTTIDHDGAMVPGGVRGSRGGSTSFDPDTREVETDRGPADNVEVAGKVKRTVEFDADGKVMRWSVSPEGAIRTDSSN